MDDLSALGCVLFVVFSYLLGALNAAILVSRYAGGVDPRTVGSGNPGATNVYRAAGKKMAVLVLFLDGFKGFVPLWYLQHTSMCASASHSWTMAAFLAVILGHLYPIFFRFRGGKGVATVIGASLGLVPAIGFAFVVTWLAVALTFRLSSLAAIVASLVLPLYSYFLRPEYMPLFLIITPLLLWRHRDNIRRLIRGEEKPIGYKKPEAVDR